jgi:hypothetical protein
MRTSTRVDVKSPIFYTCDMHHRLHKNRHLAHGIACIRKTETLGLDIRVFISRMQWKEKMNHLGLGDGVHIRNGKSSVNLLLAHSTTCTVAARRTLSHPPRLSPSTPLCSSACVSRSGLSRGGRRPSGGGRPPPSSAAPPAPSPSSPSGGSASAAAAKSGQG